MTMLLFSTGYTIICKKKNVGTLFDCLLKWDVNTKHAVKLGQQRVHLLQKLKMCKSAQKS